MDMTIGVTVAINPEITDEIKGKTSMHREGRRVGVVGVIGGAGKLHKTVIESVENANHPHVIVVGNRGQELPPPVTFKSPIMDVINHPLYEKYIVQEINRTTNADIPQGKRRNEQYFRTLGKYSATNMRFHLPFILSKSSNLPSFERAVIQNICMAATVQLISFYEQLKPKK